MKIFQVVQVYDDIGWHFDVMSLHRTREGAVARAKGCTHLKYIEAFKGSDDLDSNAVFVGEIELED